MDITLILLIKGPILFFLGPQLVHSYNRSGGASSLLQLNLQNHELYIAHNPITQDIHNTFIPPSSYLRPDYILIMLSPHVHYLGDE